MHSCSSWCKCHTRTAGGCASSKPAVSSGLAGVGEHRLTSFFPLQVTDVLGLQSSKFSTTDCFTTTHGFVISAPPAAWASEKLASHSGGSRSSSNSNSSHTSSTPRAAEASSTPVGWSGLLEISRWVGSRRAARGLQCSCLSAAASDELCKRRQIPHFCTGETCLERGFTPLHELEQQV